MLTVVALSLISGALAYTNPLGASRVVSTKLNAMAAKRTFDGTLKMPGEHLPQYVLENDNGAKAIVRTYGCNAFSWITADGNEVMGTRADAVKPDSDSKPYAGGAPHCFPQFGPGAIMQHGFARGMKFIPEERAKKMSFDRMIFKLEPTDETLSVWNHNFEYRVDVTLRAHSLEWEIIVINFDNAPFDITLGLHNYYDVSSLSNVVVSGPFKGAQTVDKESGATGTASSDDIKVTGPMDMLYKGVNGPVTITDSGKGTKLTLTTGDGYKDTVIWSPYGNNAMGFDKFICVEPVCADPISIPNSNPPINKEIKFSHKVTYSRL